MTQAEPNRPSRPAPPPDSPLATIDLAAVDPADMLGVVEDSPAQWRHALELALAGPHPEGRPGSVVVTGMGGSGIAGDVAALLAAQRGTVPVVTAKGYELPAFAGPDTLVVTVSYSGNTEETLSCAQTAAERGARRFAVTSGGTLASRAEQDGIPTVTVPPGRQPRASLAYLTVPVLVALDRAGVLPGVADDLVGLAGHLDGLVERWGRGADPDGNEALAAALALRDHAPLVYGGRGVPALVGLRAKCQINEMAKRPAFHHELPELDHNEIVGWDTRHGMPALTGRLGLLQLHSRADEHPQVSRRIEATLAVAGSGFGTVHHHALVGDTALQRLAAGILFVDLVAVYLALLAEVDPTPVEVIEQLKRRIAPVDDAGT